MPWANQKCDACGEYRPITLVVTGCDLVEQVLGVRHFCESCGAFLAGVLVATLRIFKRP